MNDLNAKNNKPPPNNYVTFLDDLKQRVRNARLRASLSVNRELILLYWQIGKDILLRQQNEGWGTKVIDRLANDLKKEFPEMKGFSPRNLKFMRGLAEAYSDEEIVKQAVSQIPWGHNIRIIQKIKDKEQREWYVQQTIQNGWSRNVLIHHIDSNLYQRQGQAVTNFERTLPEPQSDLAHQLLKDPYNFDFLSLEKGAHERELERGLIEHLKSFLLELGKGFAFVGSQYHLEIGDDDYYLDLLFYHLHLRAYVVIELKTGKFRPEDGGKMNFYLSAVDDILRHDRDEPSIGLILCRENNRIVVEYALRDTSKPIGVSTYVTEALPKNLKGIMPTVEELEAELSTETENDSKEDNG